MIEENEERTELSELGEFGLIDHLTKNIELQNATTLKGVGDDAAVIDQGDHVSVVTTDMLLEGVHFDLAYTPLKHLGYKAIISNLSDVYAMNATPEQVTVSIALSNRFSVEALEEFYAGIYLACEKYGVDLVGGDTTSSLSGLVISVTAIGKAKKENIAYRNGAKVNDLICVSGDLGAAYLGLQILEREKQVFKENPGIQPDLEGYDYLLERQLKPEARKDIITMLAALGVKPTSMMDISDGLSSELIHICTDSGVGCNIYDEKLPMDATVVSTAQDFALDPSICALNGGEDYELLFTVDIKEHEKFMNNPDITIIGHITDKDAGMNIITRDGRQHTLTAQGWDSLLQKQ